MNIGFMLLRMFAKFFLKFRECSEPLIKWQNHEHLEMFTKKNTSIGCG